MAVGDRTQLAGTAYDRLRILTTCRNIAMVGLSSNQYQPSAFAGIYLAEYGETLEAAIRDDFSGSELSTALGLMNITDTPAPPPDSIAPETTATVPRSSR